MNLPNIQNVVHESETQRQFVRLPVPAIVTLDGQEYEVKDLSSGGLSVEGVTKGYTVGARAPLMLTLPFTAFSLDINIDAEVQYYSAQNKTLGCQFVNVTPDQVSLLNHVIKSYMAGEIVKSGDLLNVAARENFVSPRKKAATDKIPVVNIKRQIPGLIMVGALGVLAATFIIGNLYDSMYTLRSSDAVVQGPEVQVRAVVQGEFISKIPAGTRSVKERQELGTVNGDDVKSPCNCLITEIHRQNGEFVIAGDPIVSLVPEQSSPWIVARLKPSEASRLSIDSPAKVTIAGQKAEIVGKVASIKSDRAVADDLSGSRMVQVRIVPEQKLSVDLAGRPAKVVFEMQ